jgi:hypothetical protein
MQRYKTVQTSTVCVGTVSKVGESVVVWADLLVFVASKFGIDKPTDQWYQTEGKILSYWVHILEVRKQEAAWVHVSWSSTTSSVSPGMMNTLQHKSLVLTLTLLLTLDCMLADGVITVLRSTFQTNGDMCIKSVCVQASNI